MTELTRDQLRQLPLPEYSEYLNRRAYLDRRGFLRRAAIAGGAVAAGPVLLSKPGFSAAAPSGGHLAFGADPSREMTVSWATAESVEQPVVDFGRTTAYSGTVKASSAGVPGTPTVYHHVRLRGLTPDATYHYRVRHRGGASKNHTFRTAPATPRAFRFTTFGDQGVNADAIASTARVLALNPAFHFHVGDLCYANSGGMGGDSQPMNQALWDQWFNQVTGPAAKLPWMPTVGNHEMEPGAGEQGYDGFLNRFVLPANGVPGARTTTYSFRYNNVAVVALDGNDASYEIAHNNGWLGGRQESWLRAVLAGYRRDKRVDFIVAGFHNCMYCCNAVHASDGGNRDKWGPIFDEFAVDLVVNGHNHCYERAHPIKGGEVTREVGVGGQIKPATDGTTYITAGHGGQAGYPVNLYPLSYVTIDGGLRIPETATWSAVRDLDASVLAADVTPRTGSKPATMRLRAMLSDGTVIDDVTLIR